MKNAHPYSYAAKSSYELPSTTPSSALPLPLFTSSTPGFTIIEVVLVLAIAGLIFLTVFLALPALQKSQRDTARRQDVGKVVAALQSYRTDNGGWPATATYTTTSGYFTGLAQVSAVWVRPSGATCSFATDDGALSIATVAPGCKCDQVGTTDTSVRFGYVHIKQETNSAYCKQI